ncbi:MAG: hypothetical protein F8N36_14600 [Desulfovibrio sp.]|uniref:hypothetical protein n=1 Tax=Desulfovibrio sp. TaxID=885 RepID=UPI00135DC2CD|nr:hypothetical protein [Desulfovibrio sp.]MTJ94068.1 hypothetical protein [Desulfovibrio sp.]
MDFTVEGKSFRAMGIEAVVLDTDSTSAALAAVVSVDDAAGTVLRLPSGAKGWQAVALLLEHGTEVQLPLPQDFTVQPGDALVLGCLGPLAAAQGGSLGENAPLEVYAVRRVGDTPETAARICEFADAATVMKRCGLARATEYEVEKYPLKKVCKVSAIVFLVGLVCFSFLMHLFTESMDELLNRLPEVLWMSAKFGGVSALVVAVGGGLFVKSSNDYNSKKKYEAYAQQFEQVMAEALASDR